MLLVTGATCALAMAKAQAPLCVDETFHMPYAPTGNANDIEFMADGRIVVGGYLKSPGEMIHYFGLTRLEQDGAIDPFGPNYLQSGARLRIQDEYLFLMTGGSGYPRVFLSDGSYDYSYLSFMMPEFSISQTGDYHIFPDGKQWRTGKFSKQLYDEEGNQIGNEQGYGLVQVLPDGHADPEFDHKRTWPGSTRALRETPDGRFLISSTVGAVYEGHPIGAVARIWPDGHLDTTFHSTITWGVISRDFYFYPDGRILVFGNMLAPEYPNDTLAVMRLHPDGSTDTTWPSIPFLAYGYFRGLAAVWDRLEVEPGKLILVGDFNAIGAQPFGAITTIDTAGNVLWDYLPGTGAGFTEEIDTNQPMCYLSGIKEGPDGYIYVYGTFSGYNDGCGDHPEQRLIARLFPLDVGVKERSKENGLRVYPNPGNGRIQLQWPGHNAINLEVQDALGRTVYREEALRAPFELDLSHLTAGVYNLLVTARDGRRASAKWIKQ